MLDKTIIIDRGVIGTVGKNVRTVFSDFANKFLIKYFGATIAKAFYRYKNLSFSFRVPNADNPIPNESRIINGFTDENAFLSFFNGAFSDGTKYNDNVEITVFMSIDEKIVAPTIYAKNSKIGQFKGRGNYRKGKTVEQAYTFSWDDLTIVQHMRRFWLDIFSEDLTQLFITNNPSIKTIFWMKKDADKLGVCAANVIVGAQNGYRGLYCVEDSNPATDTLVMKTMADAGVAGVNARASSVTTPKYYILDPGRNMYIYGSSAMDWGARVSGGNRVLSGNYSVVSVHGIQFSADLGGGIKTYRAIKVDPVGVDTLYFDYVKPSRYRVYSVTKTRNGNMKMKEISYSLNGDGQRLGRVPIGNWLNNDFSDGANEGIGTGVEDTHLIYQDIITGKFSNLSQSKMRMLRDLRFRVPFFTLIS